jgi:predicted LPLAT superfamily acyltransferase
MPQWRGKSKGNKLGYSIFVFVCRKVGVIPAYLLLRFVAAYYFLFSWSTSKHIYQFFRYRIGYGKVKSILKIYTNYYVFGQTLIDKIMVLAGLHQKFTFNFDGVDNLREIVSEGRGGILLSAHVGNWEAAGQLLEHLNSPINIVMFDGEHKQIKEYLDSVAVNKQFKVIAIKDDMSHVYAIGEALQRNELICLHADRFLDDTKTLVKDFLGAPAHIPEGPFALSAVYKVPTSFVFAFKETDTHYHFFGSKFIQRQADEDKASFISRLSGLFVSQLEEKVKRYPEQWFNYYNFWGNPS